MFYLILINQFMTLLPLNVHVSEQNSPLTLKTCQYFHTIYACICTQLYLCVKCYFSVLKCWVIDNQASKSSGMFCKCFVIAGFLSKTILWMYCVAIVLWRSLMFLYMFFRLLFWFMGSLKLHIGGCLKN